MSNLEATTHIRGAPSHTRTRAETTRTLINNSSAIAQPRTFVLITNKRSVRSKYRVQLPITKRLRLTSEEPSSAPGQNAPEPTHICSIIYNAPPRSPIASSVPVARA